MQTNQMESLVPVQQELRHCESGELTTLKQAVKDTKILKASDEEMNQALRYCMMVVGIRSTNMPTNEEVPVLKNFIKNHCGGYTLAEYRLAFELAAADQLECETKHYENFTCEYVSRIMKAYRKYANNILEFAERRMKPEMKALPPANHNPLDLVNIYYKEFLKGEISWKTVTDKAFDNANKHCQMGLKEDDYKACIAAAKSEVLTQYQESKKKDEILLLKDIPIETACYNDDVNHVAKVKCLKLWFERMKSGGVKVII